MNSKLSIRFFCLIEAKGQKQLKFKHKKQNGPARQISLLDFLYAKLKKQFFKTINKGASHINTGSHKHRGSPYGKVIPTILGIRRLIG